MRRTAPRSPAPAASSRQKAPQAAPAEGRAASRVRAEPEGLKGAARGSPVRKAAKKTTAARAPVLSKGKAEKEAAAAKELADLKRAVKTLRAEAEEKEATYEARIENLAQEANARIEEYEAAVTALQVGLDERDGAIEGLEKALRETEEDRDARIAALERARDARYQEYEGFLADGERTRAELHNALVELKGNIRVFARVRPVLASEEKRRACTDRTDHYVFKEGTDHRGLDVVNVPAHPGVLGKKEDVKTLPFTFDKVFGPAATQQAVFDEISLLVQSALDGYKVCIFAYGQTGSGKTFTMEGPDPGRSSEVSGVIPRAVRQIFENFQWKTRQTGFKYRLFCSFLQIYNENIQDLLNSPDKYPPRGSLKHEIRNTDTESVITGLNEVEVVDEKTVFTLLQKANAYRRTAETKLNEESSRSHSVFIMKIKGWNEATRQEMSGQLNLVDLAGSERLSKSHAQGDRLKETQHINKSLACLGDVIAALGKNAAAVPFRQSKLTHILQPSMTNQSKVLMFVNVNPHPEHLSESLCSLRFASKVNAVEIGLAKRKVASKS